MARKVFAPNDYFKDSQNRTVHDVTVGIRIKTQRITIGTSVVALPLNALQDRQFLRIQNVGGNPIYIGDLDVTSNNGWVILPYATETIAIEDTATIYGISDNSTDVIVMEGL